MPVKIDTSLEIFQTTYDPPRHDICHKHHKQRLCKIITTRVTFHFVNVLVVQFKVIGDIYSFTPLQYKNCILISILRIQRLNKLYCGTKNVAIYVCSSGKFPEYGKYACVKDLTNIMSAWAGGWVRIQ